MEVFRPARYHVFIAVLIFTLACVLHVVSANGRAYQLREATNAPFPATFTRGVLQSGRPALVRPGIASLARDSLKYINERLDGVDGKGAQASRIFSLPESGETTGCNYKINVLRWRFLTCHKLMIKILIIKFIEICVIKST